MLPLRPDAYDAANDHAGPKEGPRSEDKGSMAKRKRRSVLKLAGGTAAVSLGGMAGILATGRAPAYAQQKTVHWLKWVDFVPATDTMFKRELVPQAEKDLGLKINLETVNGNDLQHKVAARLGQAPGYAGAPTPRRPRGSASTSSPTCTPRRCRAWRPRNR